MAAAAVVVAMTAVVVAMTAVVVAAAMTAVAAAVAKLAWIYLSLGDAGVHEASSFIRRCLG